MEDFYRKQKMYPTKDSEHKQFELHCTKVVTANVLGNGMYYSSRVFRNKTDVVWRRIICFVLKTY